MENVVYILGAGFSAPLGLPVSANFIDYSKDLYFKNPSKYESFKEIFELLHKTVRIKNYFSSDQFNIEEILSILEMKEQLGNNNQERKKFSDYLCKTINGYTPEAPTYHHENLNVSNWYSHIFKNDSGEYNDTYYLYVYFIACLQNLAIERVLVQGYAPDRAIEINASVNTQTNYGIITLNYDRIIENCIECLNTQSLFRKAPVVNIPIAKLHGSVDTKTIILPTRNKALTENIRHAWGKAYEMLREANYIRFLGYSLRATDSYVRYLLKAANIESENLKKIDVICLDKKGDVQTRYNEFIQATSKYQFVNADIKEYLHFIFNLITLNVKSDGKIESSLFEESHRKFIDKIVTRM